MKKGCRVMMRGVLEEGNLYSLVGSMVVSGRRVTFEEPSPQQGEEVNMALLMVLRWRIMISTRV